MPLHLAYPHLPAIPVDPPGAVDTLQRLLLRTEQMSQALQSLTSTYTIHGVTDVGYRFLYVRPPRSLERPEQFSIAWPTLPNISASGRPFIPDFASLLTDADRATERFWPMVANHGFPFNLIIPERVTTASVHKVRQRLAGAWHPQLARAYAAGHLYVIDMSRFEALPARRVHGAPRFTPGTITALTYDPATQTLTPVAISVSSYRGRVRRLYVRRTATDSAWLYALQAAKASITVFGVWLGHIYQWHIVTAAMLMAMLNTLSPQHPVYQMLAPQSQFLIAFDDVLMQEWANIVPPTSLASAADFLSLANRFAAGRSFFDDDPRATLSRLGLVPDHFSSEGPWDLYPVVQRQLAVWDLVAGYVRSCVDATYLHDASVANDAELQLWMTNASAPTGANLRGLGTLRTKAALEKVLTSILYRITIHGVGRLNAGVNPVVSFISNFPHCLQRTDIPHPSARLSTQALLSYLPNTGTIGTALNFYFIFAFSPPYQPFIPLAGDDTDLFYSGGVGSRRNQALIRLRKGLAAFIADFEPDGPQLFQWPRNIET